MAQRQSRQEYAVIGLGRFGSSVALTLVARGHTVLGIDQDPNIVQDLSDELTQTVSLDSTDEDALRAVDIASYRTVVIAIGTNFEANLLTLAAIKSTCGSTVICKATTERQRDILLRVGADRVVLPEHEGGQRLAEGLTHPGQINAMDCGTSHCIVETRVPRELVGQALRQVELDRRYGATVLAVRRGSRVQPNPNGGYVLQQEDTLVVLGAPDDVARLTDAT